MLAPYILVYKKKNNMLVPVSSGSATSYDLSASKLNPELMNKYDVLKELNTQCFQPLRQREKQMK